jgi:hypothetical protein
LRAGTLNDRSGHRLERFALLAIDQVQKLEGGNMRKIVLSLAALAALGFALPYAAPAKADTVVIHRHHHHWWHPHHDTVVIHHD